MAQSGSQPTHSLAGAERWAAGALPPAQRELDEDYHQFESPVFVFTFEHVCWAFAAAYAIASRLIGLGDRPLAPSEARIALFDYRLSHDGLSGLSGSGFTLGVLIHLLQAAVMRVAVANDFFARLAFASCALGLIAIAFSMRRYVGRVGALAVASLIAISPTITWLSRSDSIATVALVAALITVRLFLAFCRKPTFAIAAGLGVSAALTMSCDPAGMALAVIMALAGLLLIGWEALANPDFSEDIGFLKGTTAERLAVAAIICAAFYVSLTPHPLLMPGPRGRAIGLETIGAGRGYVTALAYYGPIAASYEILIVILACAGSYLCVTNRVRSPFARWSVIWAALSTGLFLAIPARSVAFAALMVVPLVFVAGFAVDYLFHTRSWRWARIPLAIAAAATVYFQIASNDIYATPMIAVGVRMEHAPLLWNGATTEETRATSERIATAVREARLDHPPTAYVGPAAILDPVRWYLRDLAPAADPNRADVVVLPEGSANRADFAQASSRNIERIAVLVENPSNPALDHASLGEMVRNIFAVRPLQPIEIGEATIAWQIGTTPAAQAASTAAEAAPSNQDVTETASRTFPTTAAKPEASELKTIAAEEHKRAADNALIVSPNFGAMVSPPASPYGTDPISKLPLSAKGADSLEIANFEKRSIRMAALGPLVDQNLSTLQIRPADRLRSEKRSTKGAELEPLARPKLPMLPLREAESIRSESKVLIVGGKDEKGGFITASAEFFDGASDKFIPIKTGMNDPRESYSATRLPNGQVLIAGGKSTADGDILATAEIFDPQRGTFAPTHGIMRSARQAQTATPLANGKVLIAGGFNALDGVLNTGELFDPATGIFSSTGNMTDGRRSHTATELRDGRVLLAGGIDQADRIAASAEIFDPASGRFEAIVDMNDSRYLHTATALKSGKVLLTGGIDDAGEVVATVEIFDPATRAFSRTAGLMSVARYSHAATLLRDGMVLITGGFTNRSSGVTPTAEVFDPATETFAPAGRMNEPRESHAATLLRSGKVLITGGGLDYNGQVADSAELFDPVTRKFALMRTRMVESREVHTATLVQ